MSTTQLTSIFSVASFRRSSSLSSSSSNSTMRRFSEATSASAWMSPKGRFVQMPLAKPNLALIQSDMLIWPIWVGGVHLLSHTQFTISLHNRITTILYFCSFRARFLQFFLPQCSPFRLVGCLGCLFKLLCGDLQTVLRALQVFLHQHNATIQRRNIRLGLHFFSDLICHFAKVPISQWVK